MERPLKYFTLTTPALYDVRILERSGLIERTERGYPGVGFCELNDKDYAEISRRLRRCSWSYKGYFEEMVSNHPDFETSFGFDVVNRLASLHKYRITHEERSDNYWPK